MLTTGANSGIGLACAVELARRGFRSVGSVRSEAKAEAVANRFPQAIVIGGDQVPATSTTILNKPGNAANCREQLMLLSGSTAEFYTACTVRCLETGVKLSHVDTTAVKLRPAGLNIVRPTTIWPGSSARSAT